MPSVRYMYTTDVASEPRAKPVRPITEPVMHTARDPYRVIAMLMKMPKQMTVAGRSG